MGSITTPEMVAIVGANLPGRRAEGGRFVTGEVSHVQCKVYDRSHRARCNRYIRMMLETCAAAAAAVVAAAGCM